MTKQKANYKGTYDALDKIMEAKKDERPAVIEDSKGRKCVVWRGTDSNGGYYKYVRVNSDYSVTFVRLHEDGTAHAEDYSLEVPPIPVDLGEFPS